MENYLLKVSKRFQNEISHSVKKDPWNLILGFSWHFCGLTLFLQP